VSVRPIVHAAVLGVLVVFLAAAPPMGARAQAAEGAGAADRAAIRHVIEGQLDAFRRDDGVAAFSFASPSIRRMFGAPDNFMDMVRRGYQPVYRPRRLEFRDLVEAEGKTIQPVLVLGPDNVTVMALYVMERQADGSWLIDGCYLVPTGDKTA
jgi:hypothetical protein